MTFSIWKPVSNCWSLLNPKMILDQSVSSFEHGCSDRVDILERYVHDLCIRVMPFPQTRLEVWWSLEYCVALRPRGRHGTAYDVVQNNAHELRQPLNWDSGKPCGQKMPVQFYIYFVKDKTAELSRKRDWKFDSCSFLHSNFHTMESFIHLALKLTNSSVKPLVRDW